MIEEIYLQSHDAEDDGADDAEKEDFVAGKWNGKGAAVLAAAIESMDILDDNH